MELRWSELGKFTQSIAARIKGCADGLSADGLLTEFKTFGDWFCTSKVKGSHDISKVLRKFRSAVNITEKAKKELDEYRDGRSIMRCSLKLFACTLFICASAVL